MTAFDFPDDDDLEREGPESTANIDMIESKDGDKIYLFDGDEEADDPDRWISMERDPTTIERIDELAAECVAESADPEIRRRLREIRQLLLAVDESA